MRGANPMKTSALIGGIDENRTSDFYRNDSVDKHFCYGEAGREGNVGQRAVELKV